jgi:hypothetical protein
MTNIMVHLCSNRPEGFGNLYSQQTLSWRAITNKIGPLGPESHLYSHITTSCFNDVILVPLMTWVYFLLTLVLYLIYPGKAYPQDLQKTAGQRWLRLRLVKDLLYALALFVATGMSVVEIARLALGHFGVGLLPFQWVAFALAGILRFTRGFRARFSHYWIAAVFLWIALIVVNVVKIVEELKEGIHTRKGTKYPMSDEVTDVGVLIGTFAVLTLIELWR